MGLFYFLRRKKWMRFQNLPIFSLVETFCAENKIFGIMD